MTKTTRNPFDAGEVLRLRDDLATQAVGSEVVLWPLRAEYPTYLDPVAALLSGLLDGTATNHELIMDIHETLEVPLHLAQAQLHRAIGLLSAGRVLEPATESATHWLVHRRLLPEPDW